MVRGAARGILPGTEGSGCFRAKADRKGVVVAVFLGIPPRLLRSGGRFKDEFTDLLAFRGGSGAVKGAGTVTRV